MENKYAKGGIFLRPITEDDTQRIVRWRNGEEIRRNFIYQELFTRETHEQWIENMVKTGRVVQMIICEDATDKPLGSVYLRDIDDTHHKAEYGIFIGEASARGRGIGTLAARLMLSFAFEERNLHRVFLRVFADNLQAIRSYEKAGFQREAYLKDDDCIEGKYKDIVLMAVIREESVR